MRYIGMLMLCFLIGCSSAIKTSKNSTNELLKPQTYQGSLSEIHELAFLAAQRAFPDEDGIFKLDNGKIRIERNFFRQGDTVIEVQVIQIATNNCLIEGECRSDWHRGNGAIGDLSGELVHYLNTIRHLYRQSRNQQDAPESNT